MNSPLILHANDLKAAAPAVVFGSGLPTEIDGHPVAYRRKEIARCGDYIHPGDGKPFSITPQRMDEWVKAFNKRLSKGRKPFITPYHVDHRTEPDARDTLGYVIGMERDGEGLYATEQLIGLDALSASAKNDVSIYVAGLMDSDGDKYAEALHHLALTPMPALTNLQSGHVTLKASAASGGTPQTIPVFELSAAANRSNPMLNKETLTKLRAKLKLDQSVSDEAVAEKAAELALADPPPDKSEQVVTALSAQVATLTKERDDAKAQVLSLSANAPRQPDEVTLAMFRENIDAKREAAIRAGAVSEAQAKVFDGLIADANGNPIPLALSACGADRKPLAFKLWDAIGQLGKDAVRVGNAVIRASVAEPPEHITDYGQEQHDDGKPLTPERKKELLGYAGVSVK